MPGRAFAMSAPPTDHHRVSRWIAVGAFAIAAFIVASGFVTASGPDGRVRGFVTDSVSGVPISGATVRLEASDVPWVFDTSTDSTGYYEVAVPSHRYTVTTWSADDDQVTTTVALGSGQVLWYSIPLTPNPRDAWINGTVSDASTGAPIAGATVIAQVDGTILPPAVANATGFCSLSVPTGSVELSANALGYGPTLTSTYVWSAGEYILNIGLTPLAHGVRGYVRDGVTGAGLPGILVTVDPLFGTGYFDQETTDASGFYNIPFPPDDYVVRASAPGYTTWTTWLFSFSPGVVWANATLWPIISTVSGYLVDSLDGSHVPGLGVTAIDSRAGYSTYVYADTSGFFSLAVPPSPAISVAVLGQAPYAGNIVYVATHPHRTTWVNITLDRLNAQIDANVTDALTGLPVSGASVYAAWYYGSDWAASNATGSAVVDAPARATTYVSAWATGYVIWSSVLTPAAGSHPLTGRLFPDLPQDLRIFGYVTPAVTNAQLWPATIPAPATARPT